LGQIPENAPNVFPGISGATTEQKQALAGMIVWNTYDYLEPNGDGLYVWDGNKWNYTGGSDGYALCVTVPAPECLPAMPTVTFMVYNLGADAAKLNADYLGLSPAKQQMAYLATHAFNKLDACVYGGLFQWGRPDLEHAVKRPDYLRYDGTDNAVAGQSSTIPTDGEFFYGSTNWYTGTNPAQDALWGNGEAINTVTADGVYSLNSYYYQKSVETQYDPCPDGWRVPTQDEFERLSNYGCGAPQTAGGNINTTVSGHATIQSGLTWIPVVCDNSSGKCVPSNSWTVNITSSGYAIYEASVWTAAKGTGGVYSGLTNDNVPTIFASKSLHDDDAPEPLLFLPAAGHRYCYDGVVTGVGTTGFYWSSTINSYALYIISNTVQTTYANPDIAHGFSVRCVKSL
jgi:hypothetical protein